MIAIRLEASLPIVSTLHDVERDAWNSQSGRPSHSRTTALRAERLTSYDSDPELVLMNSSTARLKVSGCSQNAECPQAGTTIARAFRILF